MGVKMWHSHVFDCVRDECSPACHHLSSIGLVLYRGCARHPKTVARQNHTSTFVAPASRAFSSSSLTAVARLSMT